MKGSFRQSMSWLHTWAGLVLGWVLYFMFVTGSAGYFENEIDRWMQPEIPFSSTSVDQSKLLTLAQRRLDQVATDAAEWYVNFPVDREPSLAIWWLSKIDPETGEDGTWQNEVLSRLTGEPVSVRDTGGGRLLYRMHYRLHYMPTLVAYWLTSLCAMFMLVALISGIVIHKKIFKDFFTFRPRKKQRSWLDMHNVLSVLPLPFHLMITYSGLILLMGASMPGIIGATYGMGDAGQQQFYDEIYSVPEGKSASIGAKNIAMTSVLDDVRLRWGKDQIRSISIEKRGDVNASIEVTQKGFDGIGDSKELIYSGVSGELQSSREVVGETNSAVQFYEVMDYLHEGLFAGTMLRWLYFLSGLMGAAMIATGMLLWAVKRRQKAEKRGRDSRGLRFVEALNVGTIMGLPIGIAGYFWANRLIPADMSERADKEVLALFVVWGLMLLYPALRKIQVSMRCIWLEMLWIGAAFYGLIPMLNMLTTDKHLVGSITQGDWVMAGFDLTVLAIGCAFAIVAIKMRRDKPVTALNVTNEVLQ